MASSIRPLYSATLGLIEFSVFLGVVFPATVSAGLDSAPAPAAGSFDCAEVSASEAPAAELSGLVSDAAGAVPGKLLPFFWASWSSRAASKTGLILFAP